MEKVKDARPGRFWMDDDVIDRFGGRLGAYGIAVYTLLCRRADKNGASYPSLRGMSESLGISERQAKRELAKLRDLKLIKIEARKDERGRQQASIYTILALPEDSQSPRPEDSQSESRVTHSPPKEDPESKEGVEEFANAHSSSAEAQTVIGREKYETDRIYEAMKVANYRLPNEHFTYHLGRAQDMLAKDKPTMEELEELPAAFVKLWEIKGRADAPAALMEIRRQKGREKALQASRDTVEPLNPNGDEAASHKSRPRAVRWYLAFYDTSPDEVRSLIDEGLEHEALMDRLEYGERLSGVRQSA